MDRFITNNEEKFLKGKLKGYSLKDSDSKFNSEGKPLYFPGCSIISKISLDSDLFIEISLLQSKYKKISPAKAFSYLPSSSFHMTLFDCCNVNTVNTSCWPKDILIKDDYKKIALDLNKKIKDFTFPDKFNLKLKKLFGGYCMILEGFTDNDEKILRNFRNKLSELLGIRFPNHELYCFHITLAYILRKLNDKEVKNLIEINNIFGNQFINKFPKIVIEKPELCIFDNMYKFTSI